MKTGANIKPINPRNWELVNTSYIRFGPSSQPDVIGCHVTTDPEPQQNVFCIARMYKKSFGAEVIFLISVTFFGKGPYIQIWWEENEGKPKFNRIVKLRDGWRQLEPNEKLKVGGFTKDDRGDVSGVEIQIVDSETEEVCVYFRVGR